MTTKVRQTTKRAIEEYFPIVEVNRLATLLGLEEPTPRAGSSTPLP